MSKISIPLMTLLGTVLMVGACGEDDPPNPPPPPPTNPPAAAVITAPVIDALVMSPLTVAGTGEASADVAIEILDGTTAIGTGTGTIDAAGAFSVDVTYTEPAAGTDMTVSVVLSNAGGDSPAATVAITQAAEVPTITAPVANATVFSPVAVTGMAVANATVTVAVLNGTTTIGGGSATALTSGAYSVAAIYTPQPAGGTVLDIEVTQTVGGVTSEAATVSVSQLAIFSVSGTVSQAGGNTDGLLVRVRVYDSATEVLDFVNEAPVTVSQGSEPANLPFSFELPNGTYYLRAFRDSGGSRDGSADGHPTIGVDAQAPAMQVIVSGANVTGQALTLSDPGNLNHYDAFGVYTNHESLTAEPPWDESTSERGEGLCGGYYLRMDTWGDPGILADLTTPMVRMPDGSDEELLDDGGCGSDVADNTAMSYDWGDGDGSFSLGAPDPTAADAGNYVFHYRNTVADFIHSELDAVSQIVKLDRPGMLTSPNGTMRTVAGEPTLTWAAVTNAGGYHIQINGMADPAADGSLVGYDNMSEGAFSTTASYTVPSANPLLDNGTYRVSVQAQDADQTGDVDARAQGMSTHFIVDIVGNKHIKYSGTITNETGGTGGTYICARGHEEYQHNCHGSAIVSGATYEMYVLGSVGNCNDSGRVEATYLVDDTGDRESAANEAYRQRVEDLDSCADVTESDVPELALVFLPAVSVISPLPGAAGVGDTPTFEWELYETTYLATTGSTYDVTGKSYIMFANTGDFPEILWGLPNTATSFDMTSPPTDKYDIAFEASGGTGSGTASLGDLSSSTSWEWSVLLIDCDIDDFLNDNPAAYPADNYTACITAILGSGGPPPGPSSGELPFTTN